MISIKLPPDHSTLVSFTSSLADYLKFSNLHFFSSNFILVSWCFHFMTADHLIIDLPVFKSTPVFEVSF